ncbi:MAG: hypothetical protein LBJ65_32285 [Burkholderia sp.]|jgi:hypothetical protein|uniref:hypothetical protein n=1 Tax=Burkholderia sp. TaxID=36773 RepID=UPI00281A5BE1|nr:hypothetical protein [Burkholderia sp.]MDR0246297.1 hypothetical protein [Burkholderia sp.]
MKKSLIAATCWIVTLGMAFPVIARESPQALRSFHMGPGPVIGGGGDAALTSRTVRQPDAPLARVLVIYADATTVRPPASAKDLARAPGTYTTDGDAVAQLAPSILQEYGIDAQARSVKQDRVATLLADNLQHDRLPVLLLTDTGTQDGTRATLKIAVSLNDGDGTPLWTGEVAANYMGMQWGKRDVYAERQHAAVDALLRKIAVDLQGRRIIG